MIFPDYFVYFLVFNCFRKGENLGNMERKKSLWTKWISIKSIGKLL